MNCPTRPLLRWHGGKWRLAPWIIGHFPPHRVYVEPYGGAGSVLLRKPRAYGEVWNDLDGNVVNLFRVLRDPAQSRELLRRVELTPFAREEFDLSSTGGGMPMHDPVEWARLLCLRAAMGFGSDGATKPTVRTGFRSTCNRSGTTPAHDWRNYPAHLPAIIERLRGVVIENRPALDVMARHDGLDTLHYLDPPYLPELRQTKKGYHGYSHEMSVDDHRALLDAARDLRGMVVLSGYASPLYDKGLTGWRRVERPSHADGARPRMEVLWINPAAAWTMDQAGSVAHDR